MGQLDCVGRNKRLKLSTKLHIYNTCINPMLIYDTKLGRLWRTAVRKSGHVVPTTHLGCEMAQFCDERLNLELHQPGRHPWHHLSSSTCPVWARLMPTCRHASARRTRDLLGRARVSAIARYISWRRTSGNQPLNSRTSLLIVEVGWLKVPKLDPKTW